MPLGDGVEVDLGWISSGVGTVVDAASGLDQTGVDTGQRIGGRLRMDGVVAIPRQSNSRCELAPTKTARDSPFVEAGGQSRALHVTSSYGIDP